ncbi:MAG: hypothetical protein HPY65_09330 [Syntrophaceae bacterium]|nr:hypothetical protein [Syntrophaceae bacterium]
MGLSERLTIIRHNFHMILSDPERKSVPRMCWEFLQCSVASRSLAIHYLTSFLYRRSINNIFDYVSRKEADEVQEKINDPKLSDIVSNKLSFLEHFERGGFPVPRLLGYNILGKMYLKIDHQWESAELSSPEKLKECMECLLESWGFEELFMKPIRGSQGSEAYKVTRDHLHKRTDMDNLYDSVSKNYFVFQEVVDQHPDLAILNPSSLNTMRIDTFRAPGTKAEILSAFLRVGGLGNWVDNTSAGGVFVGIHLESGKLKKVAMNLLHGSQIFGTFEANPVNGFVFEGYHVPLFREVKETVMRAAEYLPSALIGWDVAVGPYGPVLIEANCLYYGLTGCDMAYGGYKKNPVYKKVLAYLNKR